MVVVPNLWIFNGTQWLIQIGTLLKLMFFNEEKWLFLHHRNRFGMLHQLIKAVHIANKEDPTQGSFLLIQNTLIITGADAVT